MKIIIAGSREFDNYELLKEKVDYYTQNKSHVEIVSGCARGADKLGEKYAKERGWQIHEFPAEWKRYGKKAGMIRNQKMVEFADGLICFWNGESRGAKDVINRAEKAGIKVRVVHF